MLNAILLPVVLICMMIIVNKREIMEEYVNKPYQNIIGWATSIVLILLSLLLLPLRYRTGLGGRAGSQ